jgi:hypothetical protein
MVERFIESASTYIMEVSGRYWLIKGVKEEFLS